MRPPTSMVTFGAIVGTVFQVADEIQELAASAAALIEAGDLHHAEFQLLAENLQWLQHIEAAYSALVGIILPTIPIPAKTVGGFSAN